MGDDEKLKPWRPCNGKVVFVYVDEPRGKMRLSDPREKLAAAKKAQRKPHPLELLADRLEAECPDKHIVRAAVAALRRLGKQAKRDKIIAAEEEIKRWQNSR